MDRIGASDRPRSVPVHRVQRSDLGLSSSSTSTPTSRARTSGRRHDQRDRSEPEAVHRSRRQADSVSRLERSADLAAQQHRSTTRACWQRSGGAAKVAGCLSAVHGAGHGALRRRRRPERVRHGRRARAVGRARQGARSDRRVTRDQRCVVDRTRPLCPYPQVAVYKGTGSIDEADSFTCRDSSVIAGLQEVGMQKGKGQGLPFLLVPSLPANPAILQSCN